MKKRWRGPFRISLSRSFAGGAVRAGASGQPVSPFVGGSGGAGPHDARRLQLHAATPHSRLHAAQCGHAIPYAGAGGPARIRSAQSPWPCGEHSALLGKKSLAARLVADFPDYFGMGICHTTRPPYKDEEHEREYHFTTVDEFEHDIKMGKFIQVSLPRNQADCIAFSDLPARRPALRPQSRSSGKRSPWRLSLRGCHGTRCATVDHISGDKASFAEGVLTLKCTHFEPRYVLTIPATRAAHERKMRERARYSEAQISAALLRGQSANDPCGTAYTIADELYEEYNRDHPGFFDMTIDVDDEATAYRRLRRLVMDYLGILVSSPSQSELEHTNTEVNNGREVVWPTVSVDRLWLVHPSEDLVATRPIRQRERKQIWQTHGFQRYAISHTTAPLTLLTTQVGTGAQSKKSRTIAGAAPLWPPRWAAERRPIWPFARHRNDRRTAPVAAATRATNPRLRSWTPFRWTVQTAAPRAQCCRQPCRKWAPPPRPLPPAKMTSSVSSSTRTRRRTHTAAIGRWRHVTPRSRPPCSRSWPIRHQQADRAQGVILCCHPLANQRQLRGK